MEAGTAKGSHLEPQGGNMLQVFRNLTSHPQGHRGALSLEGAELSALGSVPS